MKTDYYCKKCGELFFEDALPNINKVHVCGELAKVMFFEKEEDK